MLHNVQEKKALFIVSCWCFTSRTGHHTGWSLTWSTWFDHLRLSTSLHSEHCDSSNCSTVSNTETACMVMNVLLLVGLKVVVVQDK